MVSMGRHMLKVAISAGNAGKLSHSAAAILSTTQNTIVPKLVPSSLLLVLP